MTNLIPYWDYIKFSRFFCQNLKTHFTKAEKNVCPIRKCGGVLKCQPFLIL